MGVAKRRTLTAAQNAAATLRAGTIVVTSDTTEIFIHDGSTAGGVAAGGSSTPVLGGTASPEGATTGAAARQIYIQTDAGGTAIVQIWSFGGTVGQNTGWLSIS